MQHLAFKFQQPDEPCMLIRSLVYICALCNAVYNVTHIVNQLSQQLPLHLSKAITEVQGLVTLKVGLGLFVCILSGPLEFVCGHLCV